MFGLPPLSLLRPTAAQLARFARRHDDLGFSYEAVGATRAGAGPAGFEADEDSIGLGAGADRFARARAAVWRWSMFDLPWVHLTDRSPPAVGRTVVFASEQLGLWALSACRVVYVVDEADVVGFAYGTLADHGLSGEEQFLVRRDPVTDQVTFHIRKFSRVVSPTIRLIGPFVRSLQRDFSRGACAAVHRAVEGR